MKWFHDFASVIGWLIEVTTQNHSPKQSPLSLHLPSTLETEVGKKSSYCYKSCYIYSFSVLLEFLPYLTDYMLEGGGQIIFFKRLLHFSFSPLYFSLYEAVRASVHRRHLKWVALSLPCRSWRAITAVPAGAPTPHNSCQASSFPPLNVCVSFTLSVWWSRLWVVRCIALFML